MLAHRTFSWRQYLNYGIGRAIIVLRASIDNQLTELAHLVSILHPYKVVL